MYRQVGMYMSTDLVRCPKCKGQKQYAGMGGIFKDCEPCDGAGKVELIKLKPAPVVDSIDMLIEPVVKTEEIVHIPEVVSVAEAFESMGVPAAVIAEVREIDPVDLDIPALEIVITKDVEPFPIQEMVMDRMMEAVLAEPTMTTEEWRAKYPDIAEVSDIRQRHSMRIVYAQSKPIAPRAVDLSKSQDDIAEADPEYAAFQANEKRLIEREEAKNKNKQKPQAKEIKSVSGVGGV